MEIVFENVTVIKDKGTKLQKTVLKDFNLTFESGKITGICGGPGKSTIGKIIPALEDINKGTIKVGDYLITRSKMLKKVNDLRFDVGYLFSDPKDYLYHSNVKEEIEFGLKYYKYKLDRINNRVIDALKMVNLDESYLDRNPRELSLTEQKKVMLASVLAFNPKVLIFDDFDRGLSKLDKNNLKKLLRVLSTKFNKTIIILTNNVDFMFNLCDRVLALNDGTIAFDGDKNSFFDEKLYQFVDMPKVIEFYKFAEGNGRNIDKYLEVKDVLKAVYRDVQ